VGAAIFKTWGAHGVPPLQISIPTRHQFAKRNSRFRWCARL